MTTRKSKKSFGLFKVFALGTGINQTLCLFFFLREKEQITNKELRKIYKKGMRERAGRIEGNHLSLGRPIIEPQMMH